jgi:gas vesicle structural protein
MSQSWTHDDKRTLLDTIERILDKGVIINADISVSLVGIELLGIKIRASIASFETAARYGMEFPAGTNLNAIGWREIERVGAANQETVEWKEEKRLANKAVKGA